MSCRNGTEVIEIGEPSHEKKNVCSVCRIIIGPALVSGAWTEKAKPVEITCEEFLALDPDNKARIAYWIDGYLVEEGEAAEYHIAMDKSDHPVAALADA
ncbi:MAG: HdeA/HdeB family chaperone [Gammaproteobacteria bacterium]